MNNHPEQIASNEWDRSQLDHADPLVRQTAVAHLIQHPLPETQGDLARRLEDEDENVRFLTIVALGMLGASAVSELADTTESIDTSRILIAAIDALGRIGQDAHPAIPSLQLALRNDDEQTRWHAGLALSLIGKPSVDALIEVAEDVSHPSRLIAIEALGRIGQPAETCIERLQMISNSEDSHLRIACLNALIRIQNGAEEELEQLVEATEDPEQAEQATIRIGELGPLGQEATPTLRGLCTHEATPVRSAAVVALARVQADDEESIETLTECLQDPDPTVVCNSLRSLTHLGEKAQESIPKIRELTSHPDMTVCETARAAIRILRKTN